MVGDLPSRLFGTQDLSFLSLLGHMLFIEPVGLHSFLESRVILIANDIQQFPHLAGVRHLFRRVPKRMHLFERSVRRSYDLYSLFMAKGLAKGLVLVRNE